VFYRVVTTVLGVTQLDTCVAAWAVCSASSVVDWPFRLTSEHAVGGHSGWSLRLCRSSNSIGL